MTECNEYLFDFGVVGRREMVGRFDGGHISSFGGVGLLMMTEQLTGICRQLADCFTDYRDPDRIEHSKQSLLTQRLFAMVLGYEDLNDHDRLRFDPLLAAAVGCTDPLGERRRKSSDRGAALAGKSTLNRMELSPIGARASARYKKIAVNRKGIERLLVDYFLQAHDTPPPDRIILDLDATDVTIHGDQPGKHFHGYYGDYCYLPLYIYCGEHVLVAKLRPSNMDAARGALQEVRRVIAQIREHWPDTQILLRADSGFCRDELMDWCENQANVDYLFGLARNQRLVKIIGKELHQAYAQCQSIGSAARCYAVFDYQTQKSWSRARRVVAKAEHLPGQERDKSNPRFLVTSLAADMALDGQRLYETEYCPRGEAENRIKECQLDLFGHRLSTTAFRANQLRLWLSAVAYALGRALIRLAAGGTRWARMQTGTLREKLLKIGTRVVVTARKIWLHLSSGFPDQRLFALFHQGLNARLGRWNQ